MMDENKYVKTKALRGRSTALMAEVTEEILKGQEIIIALSAQLPDVKTTSLFEVPPFPSSDSEERGDQPIESETISFDYSLRKEDMSVVARFSDRDTAIAYAKHSGLTCTVMMPDGQLCEIQGLSNQAGQRAELQAGALG